MLFDALGKEAFALTNADDRNGAVMVQNTKASVRTYGLRAMADFRCRVVEMLLDGMQLDLDGREVWVKLLGRFDAYDLDGRLCDRPAARRRPRRGAAHAERPGTGGRPLRVDPLARRRDGDRRLCAYARRAAERHRYDRRNQGQGPEAVCGSRLRRQPRPDEASRNGSHRGRRGRSGRAHLGQSPEGGSPRRFLRK